MSGSFDHPDVDYIVGINGTKFPDAPNLGGLQGMGINFSRDVVQKQIQQIEASNLVVISISGIPTNFLRSSGLPGLLLPVNPETFTLSENQLINNTKTRAGFYREHWGNSKSQISFSGTMGGFFHYQYGYHPQYLTETAAWQYLRVIMNVYRCNGDVQWQETSGSTTQQRTYQLTLGRHPVTMTYDKNTYYGYFENFNYEHTADSPMMLKYDVTFQAEEVLQHAANNA